MNDKSKKTEASIKSFEEKDGKSRKAKVEG